MTRFGALMNKPRGTCHSPFQCTALGSASSQLLSTISVARAAAVAIFVRTLADLVKVADFPELKEFFATLQLLS